MSRIKPEYIPAYVEYFRLLAQIKQRVDMEEKAKKLEEKKKLSQNEWWNVLRVFVLDEIEQNFGLPLL